ncbi:MAG TPA: C39 family peptidase [Candidatus Woesebacteria bacterium]|nr:C39 family peptidase [Candidatus Woesebacteria bacterium]
MMGRLRFYITILSIFILILSSVSSPLLADEDVTPTPTTAQQNNDAARNEIQKKIDEYEKKLSEVRTQKNTLSSQIEYMDTQIYLTQLKTEETTEKIEATEYEIDTLDDWIGDLDSSLDQLSKTMLERIVAGYKTRQASVIDIIFDTSNASDLVNKLKYYEVARDTNKKVLLEVQEAKLNYQEQKKLREKKKDELAKLQETLAAQEASLKSQQEEKRILLTATQSDENNYSRLLEEAKRQIAAYKSFVAITGVGTVSANGLGTGEGGWYLSQRDERWAGMSMGGSSESVLDVGCFITSIAMVMRYYGADYTPAMIAGDSKYFLPGSAYMYLPSTFNGSWPNGKNYRNISSGELSSFLDRGVPVIAGVRGASHYVVLKKTDGSDYIMNDPIYGPDKKVSDYYSLSGPYGVFE